MLGFSLDAILYFMLHATYRKIPWLVVLCRGQWKSSTDFGNLASLAAQMLPVDSYVEQGSYKHGSPTCCRALCLLQGWGVGPCRACKEVPRHSGPKWGLRK